MNNLDLLKCVTSNYKHIAKQYCRRETTEVMDQATTVAKEAGITVARGPGETKVHGATRAHGEIRVDGEIKVDGETRVAGETRDPGETKE